MSFSFIERVVTPGSPAFSDDELSAQAQAVRVRREAVDHWEGYAEQRPLGVLIAHHLAEAYESLQGAENRHALMVLHNRVLSLYGPSGDPVRHDPVREAAGPGDASMVAALRAGEVKIVHEHAAMLAALRTIARMMRNNDGGDAVGQARETLERLGMGWER